MKKALLLSMLAMGSFFAANAQSSWIGGSISYSHNNSNSEPKTSDDGEKSTGSTNSIGFSPSYRRDINEKWAFGLNLGLTFSKNERETTHIEYTEYEYNSKIQTYSITPYLRRYWVSSEKFRFFTNLSAFYEYDKSESNSESHYRYYSGNNYYSYGYSSSYSKSYSENNSVGLSLIPGIEYKLNDRFALQSTIGSLRYCFTWNGGQQNYKSNSVNFSLTSSISLGLMVRLGD